MMCANFEGAHTFPRGSFGMNGKSHSLRQWTAQAVLQGMTVWAAYAFVEFLSTAVLFRVVRPFLNVTTWQWAPLSLFAGVYLLIGAFAGLSIGLAVYFVSL